MDIKTMKRRVLLVGAVIGSAFVTAGADSRTNQLMIGDTVVDAKVVDGKLVGERFVVISNSLFHVQVEATPLPDPPSAPAISPSSQESNPCLRLTLRDGDGPIGSVKGLHGLICMATNWRTPNLGQMERVDIIATDDKTKIVVMVRDNGPIYSSTNSGMTWRVMNSPGEYEFSLTAAPASGGFFAKATIYPSPENQSSTDSTPSDWYVVGSASDGSKLVIASDSLQPTPALSIKQSTGGIIVSWPAAFRGFALQATSDLNSMQWVSVTNSINVVGGENQVFIGTPTGNNFYRLNPR